MGKVRRVVVSCTQTQGSKVNFMVIRTMYVIVSADNWPWCSRRIIIVSFHSNQVNKTMFRCLASTLHSTLCFIVELEMLHFGTFLTNGVAVAVGVPCGTFMPFCERCVQSWGFGKLPSTPSLDHSTRPPATRVRVEQGRHPWQHKSN